MKKKLPGTWKHYRILAGPNEWQQVCNRSNPEKTGRSCEGVDFSWLSSKVSRTLDSSARHCPSTSTSRFPPTNIHIRAFLACHFRMVSIYMKSWCAMCDVIIVSESFTSDSFIYLYIRLGWFDGTFPWCPRDHVGPHTFENDVVQGTGSVWYF